MTPTDPQGAEGRETRTEWRAVVRIGDNGKTYTTPLRSTKDEARDLAQSYSYATHLGYERVETITQVTRHQLAGQEAHTMTDKDGL